MYCNTTFIAAQQGTAWPSTVRYCIALTLAVNLEDVHKAVSELLHYSDNVLPSTPLDSQRVVVEVYVGDRLQLLGSKRRDGAVERVRPRSEALEDGILKLCAAPRANAAQHTVQVYCAVTAHCVLPPEPMLHNTPQRTTVLLLPCD